ncbi:MAG: HEAT repeat domain-containing protein [candidate division Zixibacteria bacterium]
MPKIEVSVEDLLNQLSSPDFFEREEAVKQLGQMSEDSAIAGLVLGLEDEDRGIRELAADHLVKIGGSTCSQLLASFMGHDEISVRNLAAEILIRIGRSAVPALSQALDNEDHNLRKFSLDVLGLIKDHSVAGKVHLMLDDPNENVACSAAETLGYIGNQHSVRPLLNAFEKYDFLRAQAAEALGNIGHESAFEGLRVHLDDKDPVVLYSIIEAMGKMGLEAGIEDLKRFINSDMQMITDAAIAAIIRIAQANGRSIYSEFRDDVVKKFLVDSLRSDDESDVQFALQELRHWNEPDIVKELIVLLIKSEGHLVGDITNVLKAVGTPAVMAISEKLHESTDKEKLKILDVIGISEDIRLVEDIEKLADSPNSEIREKVAVALGRCNAQNSWEIIEHLMSDSVGHVRAAAIKSIGWLGIPEGREDLLIKGLDDDYPDVREAAMGAMILLGGSKVIETFTNDLNHESAERQRLAAIALGMIGEEETVNPLITTVSHSDPAVRRSAIEALARVGDMEIAGAIRAGLNDENSLVRKAAVTALVKLLGSKAIEDIKHLLNDNDLWVRYHTIDAIGGMRIPDHSELLLQYLDDEQDIIRIAAVKALATLGDKSILEKLKQISCEGNEDLAAAVREATDALTG